MFLISNNTQIKQIAKFLDSKFKTDFGLVASASGALFPPKFGGTKTEKKNKTFRHARKRKQNKTSVKQSEVKKEETTLSRVIMTEKQKK